MTRFVLSIALMGLCLGAVQASAADLKYDDWAQYEANPFVIPLEIPPSSESEGGIIVADVNDDGLLDYLVTVKDHLAVYGHNGEKLWIHQTPIRVGGSSEGEGLPGHNGPGVTAGDIDKDGATEVLYFTNDNLLHVVAGATGEEEWTAQPPVPEGAERWEHLIIANFRGEGDVDLLVQATNKDGYRMGRYVEAYSLADLRDGKTEPLWRQHDFLACAHNGARITDLDGDGKDEVLGGTVLDSSGKILHTIPLRGHIDSIFVYDVHPKRAGLEIVALEEGGGNRIFLFNRDGMLWETDYQNWEPQNAAVGQFNAETQGLEVWCRSRFNTHQRPFSFNAKGELIRQYEMDDVAPEGWTDAGVETINTIDWTGETKQLACARERHTEGDVCLFDPISGAFVKTFDEKTARLFVADVSGDWREEIVVLNGHELHVYHNADANPRPDAPRLWSQPHYKRSKMTYNYYSP